MTKRDLEWSMRLVREQGIIMLKIQFAAVAMAASVTTMSAAAERTWTHPNGGLWTDATRWSGGVVPGPDDTAILPDLGQPYTVRVNGTRTVGAVHVNGLQAGLWIQGLGSNPATLAVLSDSANLGTLRLAGANNAIASKLSVAAGATFSNNGTIYAEHLYQLAGTGPQFGGGGTVSSTGTVTLDFDGGGELALLDAGTTFVQAGGVVQGRGGILASQGTTLRWVGGLNSSDSRVVGGRLEFPVGANGTGHVLVAGGSLQGDVPAGVEVVLEVAQLPTLAITVSADMRNEGRLRLRTTDSYGVLLKILPGVTLTNFGTIVADDDAQGTANDVYIGGGGTVVNGGVVEFLDGATLGLVEVGTTLAQAGGILQGVGGIAAENGTRLLWGDGNNLSSESGVRGGEIEFSPGATGSGRLFVWGGSGLRGDVPENIELRIEGGGAGISGASLNVLADCTNAGVIRIHARQPYGSALGINSDVVFTNRGVVRLESFGATTVSIAAAGTFHNLGDVTCEGTTGLRRVMGAGEFHNEGTVSFYDDAILTLFSGITFHHAGGIVQGPGGVQAGAGATYRWSGGLNTSDRSGVVGGNILSDARLEFPTGADGSGKILALGGVNAVEGEIPENVQICIQDGFLAVTADSTNAGTIRVIDNGQGGGILAIDRGATLQNIGVISFEGLQDASPELNLSYRSGLGTLHNDGTIIWSANRGYIYDEGTVSNAGTILLNMNGGFVDVGGSQTTFSQIAGAVQGNGGLRAISRARLRWAGGTIASGAFGARGGIMEFPPGSTGAGRVLAWGADLIGDVPAGVEIWVQGGGGGAADANLRVWSNSLNGGAIRLESLGANLSKLEVPDGFTLTNAGMILSSGDVGSRQIIGANNITNLGQLVLGAGVDLTVAPGWNQPAGGEIVCEIAGALASELGRMSAGGAVNLDGMLRVRLVDGFMPAIGDVFDVITHAPGGLTDTLQCDDIAGREIDPWRRFVAKRSPTRLSLVAVGRGDMNTNGTINVADIGPFVAALTDPAQFAVFSEGCESDILLADVNCNGEPNVADIGVFVGCITAGCVGCP